MKDCTKVYEEIKAQRFEVQRHLKEKRKLMQQEYEEIRDFSEITKQKYARYYAEINQEIKKLNDGLTDYQDELMVAGFIEIEKFANDACHLLSKYTNFEWEIVAIAFQYKKRQKGDFGLQLINTDANIVGVAKKDVFSKELIKAIFGKKDWLSNNQEMMAFMEHVQKGDIVLLHIVEKENDDEKFLNLFESGFNGDFDKHLLRFDLHYNEKNPATKYPFLQTYLDEYVFTALAKKEKK